MFKCVRFNFTQVFFGADMVIRKGFCHIRADLETLSAVCCASEFPIADASQPDSITVMSPKRLSQSRSVGTGCAAVASG